MRSQTKAYLFALMAVFLWSTVATAFKLSLRHLNYIQLLFIATAVSFFTLSVIISFSRKWKEIGLNNFNDLKRSMLLGALNPTLYYLILLKAYSILPAQEAMALNYTWPLMLVLLSVPLLGQKLRLKGVIALIISFTGILLIAGIGQSGNYFSNSFGYALAVGSSVIWALFWLFNVKDQRDTVIKLWWGFLFGFVFISLIMTITGNWIFRSEGLFPAIYVGLFEMGITFVFWLKALQLTERTEKVSQLIFLSPFLSLFWIQIALGEDIRLSTLAGLVLIVSGILIQQGIFRFYAKKNQA